jgi:hypothetical protein
MTVSLSKSKIASIPLRRHRNGQWYKSVWNSRTKQSEQFYFGKWADDFAGERALLDPTNGWLARRQAIEAGIDNPKVLLVANDLTLGELMTRFLTDDFFETLHAALDKVRGSEDGILNVLSNFKNLFS